MRQLAITQSSVVDPGRLLLSGSMLRLSRDPHLRDKEACLPRFHHPTVLRSIILAAFFQRISKVSVHLINQN